MLRENIIDLETEVKKLEDDIMVIESQYEKEKEKEQKLHEEEINTIKKKNQKLKEILEKRLKGEN